MLFKSLIFSQLLAFVLGQSLLGCYSSLPSSFTDFSEYQYQTSSYCASQCEGYSYFALTKGNTCICGDDAPTGDTSDDCDTPCYGYGSQTCGGDDSYDVYSNGGSGSSGSSSGSGNSGTSTATSSTDDSSSTGTATTGSSSKTSGATTTTNTSTSSAATDSTADAASSAISTQVSGGTTSVIYSTVDAAATSSATATETASSSTSTSTSTSTSDSDSDSDDNSNSKKKNIVGPVVGGVVGGLALVGICVCLFFFLRRRQAQEERDAELADSAYYGAMKRDKSQLSRPISNPFLTKEEEGGMVDQRLNPVMLGRRRISEGSLADEADYSRKILRVANPDD